MKYCRANELILFADCLQRDLGTYTVCVPISAGFMVSSGGAVQRKEGRWQREGEE